MKWDFRMLYLCIAIEDKKRKPGAQVEVEIRENLNNLLTIKIKKDESEI